MKIAIRNIIFYIGFVLLFPIKYFIKKKNIVILQSNNNHRYGGNPKYLFEYLNKSSELIPYWVTESEEIMKFMDSVGFRYISNRNIFKKLLVTLRAKVVISSGTGFYDPFFLVSRDKNIIKICTMHGSGPKLTVERKHDINKSISIIRKINSFDCVSFCTEHALVMVGINQLFLPRSRSAILGAPKNDILMDDKYVEKKYKDRELISKLIYPKSCNKCKVIYYAPTFRLYKANLPIFDLDGFDENRFNDFLERNNIYFFYSNHSLSSFNVLLKESKRIKRLTIEKYPLFDNLELIMEADMFVGDYSTLSSDFAILKRPQLFIMPDYNKHYKSKGLAEDLRTILPGKEIFSFNDFLTSIEKYISDKDIFVDKYNTKIDNLLEKYIDVSLNNSRQKFKEYILENIK